MSKKLTPWFPASVKPVREGLYEMRHWVMPDLPTGHILNCAYWNGERWMFGFDRSVSVSNLTEWRGLAQPPKE